MVQMQVAFENTEQQREALTLSDMAPKWAKRLGEHQEYLFLFQVHGYGGILNLSVYQGVW